MNDEFENSDRPYIYEDDPTQKFLYIRCKFVGCKRQIRILCSRMRNEQGEPYNIRIVNFGGVFHDLTCHKIVAKK